LPSVLDAAIGDIERVPPGDTQDFGGFGSFPGAVFSCAARSHFTLGQVENACAMSALRHFEQRAAAGLFDVVAVGSNGEDVECRRGHARPAINIPVTLAYWDDLRSHSEWRRAAHCFKDSRVPEVYWQCVTSPANLLPSIPRWTPTLLRIPGFEQAGSPPMSPISWTRLMPRCGGGFSLQAED